MKLRYKFLIWLPLIIIIFIIFMLSSENGKQSSELSRIVTEYMIRVIHALTSKTTIHWNQELFTFDMLHYIVRKLGHMTEYAILAITVSYPFHKNGIRKGKSALFSLGICFLYACSDEFHQLFIADRYGKSTDVIIDCLGAFLGIIFFHFIVALFYRVSYDREIRREHL
jgi:VanZ family protein